MNLGVAIRDHFLVGVGFIRGDDALRDAIQSAPLLRAFSAAAATAGVSPQTLHVVVTRTSPDTQGADLPGELNEHNSSIVTQQSLLTTVVLGCMGADAHIVELATSSDSGRSNTGFTAEAMLALTRAADCAWVTTYHRQGRGNKAMKVFRELLSSAKRRLLGAFAPDEMFEGLDATEADAELLLLRMWGTTAAVRAGIAAYPDILTYLAAHIKQRFIGANGVTRLLLPFFIFPNEHLDAGGAGSFTSHLPPRAHCTCTAQCTQQQHR